MAELESLLRRHLMLATDADDQEPAIPFEAGIGYILEGAARCRSVDPDSVASGLRLIIDGMHAAASQGSHKHLVILVDSATYAANAVKQISKYEPEAVKPVARVREEWPSTISLHSDWDVENKRIVQATEVATKSRLAKRMLVKKTPANGKKYRHIKQVYCERLVDIVDAAREWLIQRRRGVQGRRTFKRGKGDALRESWPVTKSQLQLNSPWILRAGELQELDRETAGDWFDVGWEGWKALTKQPYDFPVEIGKAGVYEETKKMKKGRTLPGQRRGDRRHGLRRPHQEVFMKLFGR